MNLKGLEAERPQLSAERPWQNSLGMKLVPVSNTKVLFCIWLTRVRDYEAYATVSLGTNASWKRKTEAYGLPINEGPGHPICHVSWEDAKRFCGWLTRREQELGLFAADWFYRLPTDEEWSQAVGLTGEPGRTPEEKHRNARSIFPWGGQWPPPAGAGNFADETLHASNSIYPRIVGYNDGFATTSPVGSFAPNKAGLFDMSGNLLEWCEDEYSPGGKMPPHLKGARPLRGGAWTSVYDITLTSGHRHYENPKVAYDYYGFRVVLAKENRK
jgi:formylglycine-generating enzyme required for sulfatase activity